MVAKADFVYGNAEFFFFRNVFKQKLQVDFKQNLLRTSLGELGQ